jgi:3D (Asp-Asp-Asp) domain-containing protein
MATYKTVTSQSVYDLSIQLYGDLSKIGNLIKLFPNLDNVIPVGSEITVETQTDPIAKYFSDRRLMVATDTATELAGEIFDSTFDSTFS